MNLKRDLKLQYYLCLKEQFFLNGSKQTRAKNVQEIVH